MYSNTFCNILKPILPYGIVDTWEDLNPKLYHGVHIYWLKFYGLWFNKHSVSSLLFWLQMVYGLLVLWLVCFLPGIGEVLYLVKRSDNIADIAEGLYLFLSEMYTYFKLTVFWVNKKKILALLKYLKREEFRAKEIEHQAILKKSIKTSRFLMSAYSLMCVCAVSVGIIMPITEDFEVLPTNVEYPVLDVYRSPTYEIFYLHHIYYKPATCIIDAVMDTILASFLASVIGQIEILSFNLINVGMIADRRQKRITSGKRPGHPREYYIRNVLKDCIIHHNSIIRYVSLIESTFSLSSALQFMLSAMVLCLVGIQFLSIENPASHPMQIIWMIVYMSCMLTEVFILCWFGNELMWKSSSLQQAAYDSNWVSMEESSKIFLKLIMQRCQRPLRVTAGKLFTLSLDNFTNLINWSYKAFAVMTNMKK